MQENIGRRLRMCAVEKTAKAGEWSQYYIACRDWVSPTWIEHLTLLLMMFA
jgi:hypothetical protein